MFQVLGMVEAERAYRPARELERRLTIARQLREGRPKRLALRAQLLIGVADALIALGESLQLRAETA
jgi:hypothetical protein